MIQTSHKLMLMAAGVLEGAALFLQATPSLDIPSAWANVPAWGIVGFVVYRLFIVEMPEWRRAIEEIAKGHNEQLAAQSVRIEALRDEVRSLKDLSA